MVPQYPEICLCDINSKMKDQSNKMDSKIDTQVKVKKVGVKNEVVLALPDIRSSHNVGAIFRTADGVGVSRIILAGHSPCPVDKFARPQSEIAKTALGAEKSVPWIYEVDATKEIKKLKKDGYVIIALEQTKKSISYKKILKIINMDLSQKKGKGDVRGTRNLKICLLVGNEVEGVSKKLLNLSDYHVDIPMRGEKESLNVSVATGIVLYELL